MVFFKKAQGTNITFIVVVILAVLLGLALIYYIYKLRGNLLP